MLIRKITLSSIKSMGLRIIGLILAFLAQAILSNLLGLEGFSQYSVFLSYVLLLAVALKFGMDITILKFGAEYFSGHTPGIINHFAVLIARRLLFNILLAALVISALRMIWPGFATLPSTTAALWMVLFSGSVAALGVFSQFFRAAHMIGWSQTLDQVSRSACLLLALLPFWFWNVPLNFEDAVIVASVSAVSAVIILGIMLHRIILQPITVAATASDRSMWFSVSLPIFGASLVGQLYAQMQILMLDQLGSATDPGLYAVAVRLMTMTTFVLTALNAVTAPMIAEAFGRKDYQKLQRIVSLTARLATVAGGAFVSILVFAGPYILLIFGEGFDQAYPALLVLCVGSLFGAMTGPVGYVMTMTDQQTSFLSTSLINLILVALLSAIGITYFGLIGAAAAAAFGQIFLNAVRWKYVWRKVGIDTSFIGIRSLKIDP
ncbi:MAG: lipopolysaccharide biosynthesis protein [Hyphomicrobiales bacterium]